MIADIVAGGVPSREVPGPAAPRRGGGRFVLAVPLVLVNASAIWGQAGWAFENITGALGADSARFAVAVMFAAAIESIGIYLAWESHEALMADQASLGLRLGSYGVGLLAGVLNFLHFSPVSFPTGIAFGALSAISPWLWAVWSRARNRGRLAQLGLVDVRAVKLSPARKLWHPVRSVRVISWAAWAGVTDPQKAVAGWESQDRSEPAVESSTPPPAPWATTGRPRLPLEAPPTDDTPVEGKEQTYALKRARVKRLRLEHPDWTQVQLAGAVGCSDRWVRNVLADEVPA